YRIYAGSRFTVYALYPECNVSITLQPNADNELVTLAVGKSIVNRSSQADIGTILLGYGGGGHKAAGTCQVPQDDVDDVVGELIQKIEA
ncbi:MAG: exopolyphosphatase, partial [Rhodospirillaceae bacterium]|nr:exopolyphosphatase [Rhodospirillaceae bacterium]